MLKCSATLVILCLTVFAVQDVSYVRYFRSGDDFKAGVTMNASERVGVSHLRVFFDKYDRILSKAKISELGTVVQEEIYEYDLLGTLLRRSIRDGEGDVETMDVYGGDEKISAEFLIYLFPDRDMREFRDRVTVYHYLPDGKIDRYEFSTVDGTPLGSILYDYFDSGLIKEERWIQEPAGRTIRLFLYDFDPKTLIYGLTEYDSSGREVSHVALVIPEEGGDQVPQIRENGFYGSASFLEESTEIIHDIQQRKGGGWDSSRLPVSTSDFIYLNNGDTVKVDLIKITERHVRFKLVGEDDTLSIPLSQVGEVERRDGEIVYPTLY